jgi:hypothetical protein
VGSLLISAQPIYAEESRQFEKLAEVLPVEESGGAFHAPVNLTLASWKRDFFSP